MLDRAFLVEHRQLTRRYFLRLGAVGAAAAILPSRAVQAADTPPEPVKPAKHSKPNKAGAKQDPYFTPAEDFQDVSRGKPLPYTLSEEKSAKLV